MKSGGGCGYYGGGSSNSNSPVELSEEEAAPRSPTNTELNTSLSTGNSHPFQALRDVMAHESAMLFDQS